MRESNKNVYLIVHGAAIAAIYVALTMIFAPISFGPVQFRIAEALCILPSNLFCGSAMLDVVFGSLATLIGAVGSWHLRRHKWLVCLPPIIANTLIVPWVLRYAYGAPDLIIYMIGTVGIGEILAIGVLGNTLLAALDRYKGIIFRHTPQAAR